MAMTLKMDMTITWSSESRQSDGDLARCLRARKLAPRHGAASWGIDLRPPQLLFPEVAVW